MAIERMSNKFRTAKNAIVANAPTWAIPKILPKKYPGIAANDRRGANNDTYFPFVIATSGVAKRAIFALKTKDLFSTTEYNKADLPLSGESSKGPFSFHRGSLIVESVGFQASPLTEMSSIVETNKTNSVNPKIPIIFLYKLFFI